MVCLLFFPGMQNIRVTGFVMVQITRAGPCWKQHRRQRAGGRTALGCVGSVTWEQCAQQGRYSAGSLLCLLKSTYPRPVRPQVTPEARITSLEDIKGGRSMGESQDLFKCNLWDNQRLWTESAPGEDH